MTRLGKKKKKWTVSVKDHTTPSMQYGLDLCRLEMTIFLFMVQLN